MLSTCCRSWPAGAGPAAGVFSSLLRTAARTTGSRLYAMETPPRIQLRPRARGRPRGATSRGRSSVGPFVVLLLSGKDLLDVVVRIGDHMHRDEFPDPAGGSGSGVRGGLDGSDVAPAGDHHIGRADVLLAGQCDVGRFHHRIGSFNRAGQALCFNHAQGIHEASCRTSLIVFGNSHVITSTVRERSDSGGAGGGVLLRRLFEIRLRSVFRSRSYATITFMLVL